MDQGLASKGWEVGGEVDQTGSDLLAFEVARLVVKKGFIFQSYVCYTWDGVTQVGVKGSAEGQRGCMHTGKGTDKGKGLTRKREWQKEVRNRDNVQHLEEVCKADSSEHCFKHWTEPH